MAFRNLFGKKEEPPVTPEDDEPAAETEPDEDAEAESGVAEWEEPADPDRQFRERAVAVIPGGSSTGSKQPATLYGAMSDLAPTHYTRAHGCVITTPTGQTLIDCTMALGSVSLGYADEGVMRAVLEAVANSPVSGLAHVSEVDVAEHLCEVIPCAERVRFLKTGAEGVAAAVRIARVATGRSAVVCSGYFGWHDWANEGQGIPSGVHAHVQRVPFDDLPALEAAIAAAGTDLACVVLEPVVERLPSDGWLAAARAACDRAGAVLIFDEMKTGFRLATGGFQSVASVTPDVAVFGKAMANGFPVAAVVGHADVMSAAGRTWITSTAAGESVALAAVSAVLERYAEVDVCESLARAGRQMRAAVETALVASELPGVTVHGLDQMWFLKFEDAAVETRFLELGATSGILFKRGAYNYAALAHDDEATLVEIERLASTVCVTLKEELEEEMETE
jgi:glutamate-1-semialdehyde 2,1-aminomutase